MKLMMMFLLFSFVSQHASGVEVELGVESVLLPCQVPVNVSSNSVAVWVREELSTPTIHVRLQSGDDLSKQNDLYKRRTSMRVDALQTGDLSLTLRNPTVSDSGTYTCITRRFGDDQSRTEVQLKVSEPPPPPPVWPIVVTALVGVVLLAVLFGALMYRAFKIVRNRAVCMLKPEKVMEGVQSVKLPWRKTGVLPAAVRVTWTREQPTHGEICVFVKDQKGQWKLQPGPGYERRVEMNNPTQGDFSLTLMKPHCNDKGLYLCVALDKDGNPFTLTIVTLWVEETWWKTIRGLILCCKDTAYFKDAEYEEMEGENALVMSENSDDKWRLSDAVSEMLKNLYGKKNVGESHPLNA